MTTPTAAELAEINRRLLREPFRTVDTPLGPMLQPDSPGLIARITREVLAERDTDGFHEVAIACDSGCGREVTLSVGADTPEAARATAIERLQGDGWAVGDGLHCRACTLLAAGWSAAPGPLHPASIMSGEFR
ncbi:hypothetical protein SEA_VANLEE_64 [Gordonia phage VanLee]|uniref:Uncharacterized protein n=1 Tax=Gordonia phage VanLee TaxID=2845816 RepID=A0A8F2DAB3_9CAUD|nr:hypothetical protein QEH49_gp064 [Gordonia phage VanLee]QWS68181.1 hypothetical protein SEA_VANLEE_64 [Gordonia phage VanLee]